MNRFVKFLFAGGIAALVNILSRYILNFFMPFEVAIVVAYGFGMLTAFLISKYFVFDDQAGNTGSEALKFIIVNIFAAAVVWVVSVTFAKYIFPAIHFDYYPEDIAHIIGVLSTAFTSYLGHKYFTFNSGRVS